MGGAVAALSCKRFFNFSKIVPCHYGTFPLIDQTPEKFISAMEEDASKVIEFSVGQTISL